MSVQFGIATMTFGGVNIGYLQNVNVDFSFEVANLFAGGNLFPVDVRTHTGTLTGSAEFADLTSQAFEKILGGTRTGDTIDLDNVDSPSTFQIVITLTTDGIGFIITLVKCRSTKLSMGFVRDGHLIPNFDFSAEADSGGNVATVDVGDIS